MQGASSGGVAGEEERSAGSRLGRASPSPECLESCRSLWSPCSHLAGRLRERNLELWWKQKERKEERTGFPNRANTQDVLELGRTRVGMSPHWMSPAEEQRCSLELGCTKHGACCGSPSPAAAMWGFPMCLGSKSRDAPKKGHILIAPMGQSGQVATWGRPGVPGPLCCQASECDKL